MTLLLRVFLLSLVAVLGACGGGGGDSSVTTISGAGLNSLGQSPAVATPFVQVANNLRVVVEDGPHAFSLSANANVLYATVTLCVPGDASRCVSVDHVQVDTGSVGLRVLASKVRALNLPPVTLSQTPLAHAWECFPFVIGGLWGANAVADVTLGQQRSVAPLAVQLIEDDPSAAIQPTTNCYNAANGSLLNSANLLGSNGILGIGSTTLDCGVNCVAGNYAGSFVQYYSCPQGATSSAGCSAAAVPANLQVYNPVAALPAQYNNGVVLKMPAVGAIGAGSASGELVLGLDTVANNQVPAGATKVVLGTDPTNRPDSYLNVTTFYNGSTYLSSYLDTGTNGLFFADAGITRCNGSTWFCPHSALNLTAVLSDGDNPLLHPVSVSFQVGNAEALFSTSNTAFGNAAGAPPGPPPAPGSAATFAWGMPFFYGRQTFLSIWQQAGSLTAPWYAWAPL